MGKDFGFPKTWDGVMESRGYGAPITGLIHG